MRTGSELVEKKGSIAAVQGNALCLAHFPKLTLREAHLFSVLIAAADPIKDTCLKRITFTPEQLADLFDLKSVKDVYANWDKVSDSLSERYAKIHTAAGGLKKRPFMAESEWDPEAGVFAFQLNNKLKDQVLQLKSNFTPCALQCLLKLRSFHAWRLFQILKSYSYRKSVTIELLELRKMLGLEDGENRYKSYGVFKHHVLEKSRIEIETKTALRFSYEQLRTGRAVTALKFSIEDPEVRWRRQVTPLLEKLEPSESKRKLALELLASIFRLWQEELRHLPPKELTQKVVSFISDVGEQSGKKILTGALHDLPVLAELLEITLENADE